MVSCCWSAVSRSIRRRKSLRPSDRRLDNICLRCRMARSGRVVTGSAACTTRCLPHIPSLKIVQRPAPDENGVERQFPRSAATPGGSRSRTACKQVRFGDPGWRLGYARDALNSYFVFQTLKEKGVLPRTCAFRSRCRWSTACCRRASFPTRTISPRSGRATKRRIRAELATIIEKIPASELAIQWDCSTEVQDAYGSIPGYPLQGSIERNLTEVRNLSPHIPSGGRARISLLLRHARRLAALPARRSRTGGRSSPTAS